VIPKTNPFPPIKLNLLYVNNFCHIFEECDDKMVYILIMMKANLEEHTRTICIHNMEQIVMLCSSQLFPLQWYMGYCSSTKQQDISSRLIP
jgi:hypothetical protein